MEVFRKLFIVFVLLAAPLLAQAGAMIDINTADARTLAKVMRGVGPAKAERIVQYREKFGPFKSIDELARVKGIGRKTVELNSQVITVKGQETVATTEKTAATKK